MLEKFYADNYKSFVNFEFQPDPVQLLLGANGSGKSTVRNALSALRRLIVDGGLALQTEPEIFPASTRTRWETREIQTFELSVAGNGSRYTYRLEVEHNLLRRTGRILLESLLEDTRPLFIMREGQVQLFRDDHSPGPSFPTSWDRSGIYNVPARHDNTKLSWFKSWMAGLCCVRIDPINLRPQSDREDPYPDETLSNFASWYSHLTQEKPGAMHQLFDSLASGVIDGFRALNLTRVGEEARALKVEIESPGVSGGPSIQRYDLHELSDGQRCLILLYTLLHGAMEPGTTLLVDDPVAYVALPEIQPWLTALVDRADEIGSQILLTSHHPEIVNHLAGSHGLFFQRERSGPVRIRPFGEIQHPSLSAAEQLARGWVDG